MKVKFLLFFLGLPLFLSANVVIGLDRIFKDPFVSKLRHQNVAIVTNQSAINAASEQAFDLFLNNQEKVGYKLVSAFAPEHGLSAKQHAEEYVQNDKRDQLPIYSLHGKTKRPTDEMLQGVDLIVYDMQNVGVRCYTYETTLFYVMEEAAKRSIPVIVLDRPNPRGGSIIEGGGVQDSYRCFFSYSNVPFCHGMTLGELALLFNQENKLGCQLSVVPMQNWERSMTYQETGLPWAAPSPNIPDSETALVYPATILLGETFEIVSVDLRGPKPFKRFGAPWIEAGKLLDALNQRDLKGVEFIAEDFTPHWGKYADLKCGGIFLKVTDPNHFHPLQTQYVLFEELLKMYPDPFEKEMQSALLKRRGIACNYMMGSEELTKYLHQKKDFTKKIKRLEDDFVESFLQRRAPYLLY